MDSPQSAVAASLSRDEEVALQDALGYLNFSNGKPDVRFQRNLNALHARLAVPPGPGDLKSLFLEKLRSLQAAGGPFSDIRQAEAVVTLVFDHVHPAYLRHHADLLFHVPPERFRQALFVARVFEATLTQGSPWDEFERITERAVQHLNDFLGHRPVAVLENNQQMQPYGHERFRPVPLYIRDVGVGHTQYREVVSRALELLKSTPEDLLETAHFQLARMEELALDVRAYDHAHPVYRRTNYTFGEWDPHQIDNKGYYRRFIVRAIILDALLEWMAQATNLTDDEKLYEAGAVLAGTILMASAVSGAGPDTHDSNVSLTSLLPRIALQRDTFYQRLLRSMQGEHADRLRREADEIHQPFGRIRQHLNLHLAHYGCRQMQRSHLATLYARMGYAEAARLQAGVIPSTSVRFETEIQWRVTTGHLSIDRGEITEAARLLAEVDDHLHRGIECGALVDPWNILGFQGHYPLFQSREDSVADQRVERLLGLMEQIFTLYSRVRCEAAAAGDFATAESVSTGFRTLSEWWDQFATTTVSDLPVVKGGESYASATQVAEVLTAWHRAGVAAGDMAFWKRHVAEFESAKSFAIVTEVLLRKQDLIAAMGLLVQWLSQHETAQLEAGPYSYFPLAERWLHLAIKQGDLTVAKKFLDYVEVNAGELAEPPKIKEGLDAEPDEDDEDDPFGEDDEREADEDDEESLFSAAYDNVVFRDSAADGVQGEMLESGPPEHDSELDLVANPLELALRFLVMQMRIWQATAAAIVFPSHPVKTTPGKDPVSHWAERCRELQRGLDRLASQMEEWEPADPSGDPDSLMEYDRQLHLKFSLLNTVLHAQVSCREAIRVLSSCLAGPAKGKKAFETEVLTIQRLVLEGKAPELRKRLPGFLKDLATRPLLYVPFDKGGKAKDILAARDLQSILRMLLARLPRLGLQREAWHVLMTAYKMERTSPPSGMSITEFDRLLQAGLKSATEGIVTAAAHWPGVTDEEIIDLLMEVCERYMRLWLKHSNTMRLCSVEALHDRDTWKRVKDFITRYGSDLFHAQVLTLSNMRAIVHRGVDEYLDYLAENEDPLHPNRLLAELDDQITSDEAEYLLELIFRCIVEKFDRFMEYNTTTTQSDYGNQLHVLLDFLRLETDYERKAWELTPLSIVHDVLLREGRADAARLWFDYVKTRTAPMAKSPLDKLKKLEQKHGVRLPSITDKLGERFVKPLVLDRILSQVRPAMKQARTHNENGTPFDRLALEIEDYLSTSSGSAMDLQPWLQDLTEEVQDAEADEHTADLTIPAGLPGPLSTPLSLQDLRDQLQTWDQPLGGKSAE